MADLGKYFQIVSDKLSILISDLERIKHNLDASEDDKKNMKSLQRRNRLRANKEDAQKASDNPDITFINDTLNDALKG